MHKKWYKIKRGLCADTKLAVVAQRAGLSRAEAVTLYICLLDSASAASPMGDISSIDTEEISILTGINLEKIESGIEHMRLKNMISPDSKIGYWAARPTASTLRVRALRAKRKAEQPQIKPLQIKPLQNHDHPDTVAARRTRLMPQNKQLMPQHKQLLNKPTLPPSRRPIP